MKSRGFTLLELLVAVAIFGILCAVAYGGYNNSARQAGIARESMERLRAIQTAIRIVTQDFEQLAPRPVRDVMGSTLLPSLASSQDSETILALTRNGWTNPAGLPRSTQQRVIYVLADNTLRRDHWTVLDATLTNELVQRPLLTGVEAVEIRYMSGGNRQWQTQWPPQSNAPQLAAFFRPLAVEIKLKLEDYGEIVRLIEVGG